MEGKRFIILVVVCLCVFSGVNYWSSKLNISSLQCDDSVKHKTITTVIRERTPERASAVPPLPAKCTPEQGAYQASNYCLFYEGRHNLRTFFSLMRFHLPDASLLVDIGANKGLVSSRWIQLYRPELDLHPKKYSQEFIVPWVKTNYANDTSVLNRIGPCGVTGMCDEPDMTERAYLEEFSPVDPEVSSFEVHSFEPSGLLYGMHKSYPATPEVAQIWHWHQAPVSNVIEDVFFDERWDEGGAIQKSKQVPNTKSVTLDHLGETIFANRTIDVVKIDAETVDALVMVGAANLLVQRRIRVIMWETATTFPVPFPDFMGGPSSEYEDLTEKLSKYADMTCYFTGSKHMNVRVTGCWAGSLDTAPPCANGYCPYGGSGCKIDHSNIVCVSRSLAPSLYRAMEKRSLLHGK